jgi:hypothetical protein
MDLVSRITGEDALALLAVALVAHTVATNAPLSAAGDVLTLDFDIYQGPLGKEE